ncbi:MAG: YggS family pyridoxal phosphate-dependent enzyme [Bacteroidetes bacterium]|nr:YggS family pyridoxal phosphate-dependent enzyme [Bacteroidota bacterium]
MPVNTEGYKKIKKELDEQSVLLVAVSKTKPVADIVEMYNMGQRDFGENYVQELVDKVQQLPQDIRWHFIGHLQSNKIKYIAPFVHLIHGVDTEKLLSAINKQAVKINRVIPVLLQVYISKDETKFGFDEKELEVLVEKISGNKNEFTNVDIRGLMGMASFTEDNALITAEFESLKKIFDKVQPRLSECGYSFTEISMGMSADYRFAVAAGSTIVRIGSLLFGERNYHP